MRYLYLSLSLQFLFFWRPSFLFSCFDLLFSFLNFFGFLSSFLHGLFVDKFFHCWYNINFLKYHKNELWFRLRLSAIEISSTIMASHFLIMFIKVSFYCWFLEDALSSCDFNICIYFDNNRLFSSILMILDCSSPMLLSSADLIKIYQSDVIVWLVNLSFIYTKEE